MRICGTALKLQYALKFSCALKLLCEPQPVKYMLQFSTYSRKDEFVLLKEDYAVKITMPSPLIDRSFLKYRNQRYQADQNMTTKDQVVIFGRGYIMYILSHV